MTAPAGEEVNGRGPARAFLSAALDLSAQDLQRLDGGAIVTRTLPASNRRELATLGVVRMAATPSAYLARLDDIETFKRTEDVLQIGRFGDAPRPADVAALTIEDSDLRALRTCRVGNCEVRLSAEYIEDVRREIDWQGADASRRAAGLVRRLLADHAARYQRDGRAMTYADTDAHLDTATEFASLMEAETILARHAPRLRRHLLDYPAPSVGATDFLYWSKERIRNRAVVSITHVAITPGEAGSPVAWAIGSRQIYAMHYYDASLGLTLLVPDQASAGAATYLVYLNRSRIDLFDGVWGGLVRRMVAGRARGVVSEQLQRIQRVMAAGDPPASRPATR
jgi:hypothetical protein